MDKWQMQRWMDAQMAIWIPAWESRYVSYTTIHKWLRRERTSATCGRVLESEESSKSVLPVSDIKLNDYFCGWVDWWMGNCSGKQTALPGLNELNSLMKVFVCFLFPNSCMPWSCLIPGNMSSCRLLSKVSSQKRLVTKECWLHLWRPVQVIPLSVYAPLQISASKNFVMAHMLWLLYYYLSTTFFTTIPVWLHSMQWQTLHSVPG